jgi:hypothetical protein
VGGRAPTGLWPTAWNRRHAFVSELTEGGGRTVSTSSNPPLARRRNLGHRPERTHSSLALTQLALPPTQLEPP